MEHQKIVVKNHEYAFGQLVDIDQVRRLLQSHHALSGMAYGVLDTDGNILIAVGWQDVCKRFHRVNPDSSGRCRESDNYIKTHLRYFERDYVEYRCGNGIIDVAMPIIISGKHLATFYAGQFFYNDDKPDTAYFRGQAEELGFDLETYLAALELVPFFSREYVRNNVLFLRDMVNVLSEMGLRNLRLANEMKERKRTEERLALTAFALDQVRDAAFLINERGCFGYVNQEACRSLGYSRAEMLGMSVLDIDPDYSPETMSHNLKRSPEQGTLFFETRHRARDGRVFPVEITSSLFEHAGARYSLALVRDITKRKQAETEIRNSRDYLANIINAIADPVFVKDAEHRLVLVNNALCILTGYSREKLLGKTDYDLFPREQANLLWKIDDMVLANGEPIHNEGLITDAADQILTIVTHKSGYIDPQGNRFVVGVIRDITERKRIEKLLHEKREKLAAMAVEITMAEERERLRIASVLHDHIGQTLLLCRIKLGILAGISKHEPVETVINEIGKLLDKVTDEAHSLTVQLNPPILSISTLENALQWLGNRMKSDYGLLVEFSDDKRPKQLSNELRSVLYQSTRELLINTAKHAGTDRAWLSVKLENGNFRLTVEDRGTGFNPDDIIPDLSRDCRLGLFSIQIRIERMGGRMEIKSSTGSGTRITISLPIKVFHHPP